jgi:hypothetical protein
MNSLNHNLAGARLISRKHCPLDIEKCQSGFYIRWPSVVEIKYSLLARTRTRVCLYYRTL